MTHERFERFRGERSAFVARKRTVVTGLVVVLVLFAGCGGDSNDAGTTTVAGGVSPTGAPTSNPPTGMTTETEARTSSPMSTTQPGVATNATSLNVTVAPPTANATNATLVVHATMTRASASNGIETITVETGGGLDLSNVTVTNVEKVGIDDGGTLRGNQTDESLASNVEHDIELTDDGNRLTIPLDGTRSIEAGDEIVAVVAGGIETNQAGEYSFNVTVDGGPSQTDDYNVTRA